jgi:hypothetical protein
MQLVSLNIPWMLATPCTHILRPLLLTPTILRAQIPMSKGLEHTMEEGTCTMVVYLLLARNTQDTVMAG